MRTLEKMHPAVCFLYLMAVLGFTAFAREPVTVLISLGGSVLLAALSGGLKGAVWFGAVAVTGALANFLFVHNGETALFFVGDRAFTLEALCYGAFVGGMLAAVCLWGACAVRFVTSDKYIWLLGRIFPAAGLVLSCAIRFLPMFIRTSREFAAVQNAQTLRGRLRAFSASVGYSAERAMDSALSMKARGYGTSPRTSFSIYRFTEYTAVSMAAVLAAAGISLALRVAGTGEYYFYPALSDIPFGAADIAMYCAFAALCLLPSAVIIYRNIAWNVRNNYGDPSKVNNNG